MHETRQLLRLLALSLFLLCNSLASGIKSCRIPGDECDYGRNSRCTYSKYCVCVVPFKLNTTTQTCTDCISGRQLADRVGTRIARLLINNCTAQAADDPCVTDGEPTDCGHGDCAVVEGERKCICFPGWEVSEASDKCDVCASSFVFGQGVCKRALTSNANNQSNCTLCQSLDATCIPDPASYDCECDEGYTYSDGKCKLITAENCDRNEYCGQGTCNIFNETFVNCSCNEGWRHALAVIPVDKSAVAYVKACSDCAPGYVKATESSCVPQETACPTCRANGGECVFRGGDFASCSCPYSRQGQLCGDCRIGYVNSDHGVCTECAPTYTRDRLIGICVSQLRPPTACPVACGDNGNCITTIDNRPFCFCHEGWVTPEGGLPCSKCSSPLNSNDTTCENL